MLHVRMRTFTCPFSHASYSAAPGTPFNLDMIERQVYTACCMFLNQRLIIKQTSADASLITAAPTTLVKPPQDQGSTT